jgi:hypothetical protein
VLKPKEIVKILENVKWAQLTEVVWAII